MAYTAHTRVLCVCDRCCCFRSSFLTFHPPLHTHTHTHMHDFREYFWRATSFSLSLSSQHCYVFHTPGWKATYNTLGLGKSARAHAFAHTHTHSVSCCLSRTGQVYNCTKTAEAALRWGQATRGPSDRRRTTWGAATSPRSQCVPVPCVPSERKRARRQHHHTEREQPTTY